MPKPFSETAAKTPSNPARPILGLLEGLSPDELEHTAIEIILLNRQYVDEAENLFERVEKAEAGATDAAALMELSRAYRIAMMRVHGFHVVVASVLDALGYVPEIRTPPAN